MSTPAPSPPSGRRKSVLGLTPRAWLYVAIAFAIGIGLFLLIWAKQRGADDFYRADTSRQSATGQVFEPLPQPDSGDTGLDDAPPSPADDDAAPSARIVETQPPPPEPTAPARPMAPAAPETVAGRAGAPDSPPTPISKPSPAYPRAALRRHESGDVLLRVHVGPDGVPQAIDLISGSGSRHLDRAATDAVRKWRFRPAMRDGRPVSGTVQVPISFTPRG